MNARQRARAYLSVLRINTKNMLAYRANIAMAIALSVISAVVLIAVWYAVYTFSGTSSINGVSLGSMVAYFLIVSAIGPVVGWSIIMDNMQSDIQEGTILRLFIRPLGYVEQLFVEAIPIMLVFAVFSTIPIIALVTAFGGIGTSLEVGLVFVGEMAIAYAISSLFGFIIGNMSVYLTNIWGIANALDWIMDMFGGAIIPLTFFPAWATGILMATPFAAMVYVPVATLTGIMGVQAALGSMLVGMAWVAALAVAARLIWARTSSAINVVGV